MSRWFRRTRKIAPKTPPENKNARVASAAHTPKKDMAPVSTQEININGDQLVVDTSEKAAKTSAPAERGVRIAEPTVESRVQSGGDSKNARAIYKQLMASFYDAILVADNKGHIIDHNRRAVEFFGYAEEELWDKPVSQIVVGLNESIYERIRRAIGNDRFVLINTRCLREDGTQFPVEVSISMVDLLGTGNFVFTIRNVERRLTQVRILRAGHNAFLNSQSGCFICDAEGNLVAANAAFLEQLNIPPDRTIVGVSIAEFLPSVIAEFSRVLDGEPVTLEGDNSEGTRRFRIQLAPNHQVSSRVEGVVGSII